MFQGMLSNLAVQSKFFKYRLPFAEIQRTFSESVSDDKQCKEPCEEKSTAKMKKMQEKFQSMEECPIWLRSTKDKVLYYTTMGLALTGIGLSVFKLLKKC